MKTFTKIRNVSESRRIPRIDKIRLGAKIQKTSGSGKNAQSTEYPVELPFFLLPESVAEIHGGKIPNIEKRAAELGVTRADSLKFIKENARRLAESLPIMIPVENESVSFPQAYKLYGGSIGLKCIGDGIEASERIGTGNEWQDRPCPCEKLKTDQNEKGTCTIKAHLQVILPEVDMGGVYQIDIGSINSIIDINSGIDYVRSLFGRVAMIPLIIRRIMTETHHQGKKQTHWTVQLKPVGDINAIIEMRKSDRLVTHTEALQIEPPDYSDPTEATVDMTYERTEEVEKMLDELDAMKRSKKLKSGEIEEIRQAIKDQDDTAIEAIYNAVQARQVKGQSADDIAAKLKKQDTAPQGQTQQVEPHDAPEQNTKTGSTEPESKF